MFAKFKLSKKELLEWARAFGIAFLMFGFAQGAMAQAAGALPWEGPMCTIQKSLTGPVAFAISIIAMVVAGGTLVFGGELGEFARKSCMLALAIALLVGGAGMLRTLFPAFTGACA